LLRVSTSEGASGEPAGTLVQLLPDTLLVQAGEGLVALREVQPAGGRVMDVAAFQRGHQVKQGDAFVDTAMSREPA
jgi:methionyl-tRNA formyltransferase